MVRKFIASALAATIALGSLATSASARDWDGGGRHAQRGSHHGGYGHDYGHQAYGHQAYGNQGYGNHGWNNGYRRHRNHTGRNVAIGAFAAVLGLALAAESNKVRGDYYEDRD